MIGLIIDIETTRLLTGPGLDEPHDPKTGYLKDDREILEVGYIRVDDADKKIISHGTLYFYKPYFQIENEAQSIHGLTRDFLKQYENDFERNLIILNSLIQKTLIIGKNSDRFDIPYITKFIDKHSKGLLDMRSAVSIAKVRDIYKNPFVYEPILFTYDVQKAFKNTYKELYYAKYGGVLSPQARGTLMDYIDVLNKQEEVDALYASLDKDRTTGAHGALYDCVATYVVWKECMERGLIVR